MSRIGAQRDLYPRSGDVAILCEGDVAAYDASILRQWADREFGTHPLVDVWPCGTGESLFGVSDAIGRSRPLLVIEDRDFRSEDDADKYCRGKQKDRRRRAVRILEWRCWKRNEIENYLLDEPILIPVMCEWFGCRENDVRDAVSEVLTSLVVFQAAEYALYHARRSWSKSDPSSSLKQDLRHGPQWNESSKSPTSPQFEDVQKSLEGNFEKWQEKFSRDSQFREPFQGKACLEDFTAKFTEWSGMDYGDQRWRIDWSGKEVLQGLCRCLSARHGWPSDGGSHREPIGWGSLSRPKQEEKDREIEHAMQRDLVNACLAHLGGLTEGPLFDEWEELKETVKNWRETAT